VARDAIARQYDVDADAVVLDIAHGLITFRAKKGRLADLDQLHESIWATRLSGRTGMSLNWIDVTAVGRVVADKKGLRLQVTGSDRSFVLEDDPKGKPAAGKETPLDQLRQALARGEKVESVTGRVKGWSGHFPPFLKALPPSPRVILVKSFRTAKK
jgi:hypothetical protein